MLRHRWRFRQVGGRYDGSFNRHQRYRIRRFGADVLDELDTQKDAWDEVEAKAQKKAMMHKAEEINPYEKLGERWPSGLERSTGGRGFKSHCGKTFRFGTLSIPFTPLCQCLSDETLNTVGPFYLVSMPGKVKYPTSQQSLECVTAVDSTAHSKLPLKCVHEGRV